MAGDVDKRLFAEPSPGEAAGFVVPGSGAARAGVCVVGGKAAALSRLAAAGVAVPAFFVIAAGALVEHLVSNRIAWPPAAAGPDEVAAARERIASAPIPGNVNREVLAARGRLLGAGLGSSGEGAIPPASLAEVAPTRGDLVAVRSSGAEEDSAGSSFAGQFLSVLGVAGEERYIDAIRACWASCLAPAVLAYRQARGLPLGDQPRFAVIVQRQVVPVRAGVVFTTHPLDPARGVAWIEANFGTGESVVGGLVTPDGIAVSRRDATVASRRTATKRRMTVLPTGPASPALVDIDATRQTAPVLSDAEAVEVFGVAMRIEEIQGSPQDIEWAYDAEGLWVLQARPLTGVGAGAGARG